MSYGSNQGRYHPNANRASGRYEPRPERIESPDSPEIVSFPLTPTGRETQKFQIMDHTPLNDDGLADCIIFTKDGIYIPKDHYLSTVPVEVVIREAQVTKKAPARQKGRPAAKATTTRKAAPKTETRRTAAAKATTPRRRTTTAKA